MIRLTLNKNEPLTPADQGKEYRDAHAAKLKLIKQGHSVDLEATFVPDNLDPEVNKIETRSLLFWALVTGLVSGFAAGWLIFGT